MKGAGANSYTVDSGAVDSVCVPDDVCCACDEDAGDAEFASLAGLARSDSP